MLHAIEFSPPSADVTLKCEECGATTGVDVLQENLWLCPACGFHFPMPARERLDLLADEGSLGARVSELTGGDPLSFHDTRPYPERLDSARKATGEGESFISAPCTIGGVPTILGALDFAFLGGTLSAAAGERIALSFERAADERRAVVMCTASGGARMQEGTLSLFQMTKTAAAVSRFKRARRPYVSVLGHPTMGGVAASFGTLADVLIAEPRARIGFAGPRVIQQILGRPLPPEFQRAGFLHEHGLIDRIVPRAALRGELARLLPLLAGGRAEAARGTT